MLPFDIISGKVTLPEPRLFYYVAQAHPPVLGFQGGVPLLSAAVHASRVCTKNGGPLLSVQLDHGAADEHVAAALEAGVDSVM